MVKWVAAGAVLFGLCSLGTAGDLFQVTANGNGQTIKAGASNVINLASDVAGSENTFSSLKNSNFNANLNYAGLANAVKVSQTIDSSGNRILNLKVPSTGLNKTFNSADGSLADQVKNFLKKDGLAALTEFQSIAGQQTVAGTVDGNPMATTALLQDAGYQQFGIHRSPFELDGDRYSTDAGQGENRFTVNGGVIRAAGLNGDYVDLNLASEIHFNNYIGLTLASPLRYEHLGGADIFMGGAVVGLPITFIRGTGDSSFAWTVTPAGHAGLVGSADFASGGLIYGGQVTSALSFTTNGFVVTLADQAGYYRGANVSIAGYDFNTRLDQWLFKNGVQLTKNFGNFFIDGGASWTNFLHNAFVDGYLSPELGVGVRFGKNHASGLRVGYEGHFGPHYNTSGGNILLFFTH